MRLLTAKLAVTCKLAGITTSGTISLGVATRSAIALPVQVDAEGHAFVVIKDQVPNKLRKLMGKSFQSM